MRDKIIEILRDNWNGSYNDCADDLELLFEKMNSDTRKKMEKYRDETVTDTYARHEEKHKLGY